MGLLNIEFADFCQAIISDYFLYISNRWQLNALRGSRYIDALKDVRYLETRALY